MTKLEEKLIELGYKRFEGIFGNIKFNSAEKTIISDDVVYQCTLYINFKNKKITDYQIVFRPSYFKTQQDIDNLQQAFNQLQKDLEVLKDNEKLD